MTKGQVEAKISEAVSKFEVEFMGRGPQKIKTMIIGDLIVIHLLGFLSQAEKQVVTNNEGIELLKKMRSMLFEKNLEQFKKVIQELIPYEIASTHSDISTVTGEKIIVLTYGLNVEESLLNQGKQSQ